MSGVCDVDKVEFTSSNGDEGFATVRGRRLSRQEPLGTLTLALTLTLTLTSTLTLTLTLTLTSSLTLTLPLGARRALAQTLT